MYSLFKKLYGSIASGDTADTAKCDLQAELLAKLAILEDVDSEIVSDEVVPNIIPQIKDTNKLDESACFKKNGIITSLTTLHGIIDHKLYFERDLIRHLEHIEVNNKVSYLAVKHGDDNIVKIVKILDVVTENWNDVTADKCKALVEELQNEKPEFFAMQVQKILGKVVERDKNLVYVDTTRENENVTVDLDLITSNFIPIKGDWIFMTCRVQMDPNVLDCSGVITEVKSLEPHRSKTLTGMVTFNNDFYGVVEQEYLFFPESLPDGFKPEVKMNVCIDAIESEQSTYLWRCLKVIPIDEAEQKSGIQVSLNEIANSMDTDLQQNKCGIVVSEIGKFQFTNLHERKTQTIVVKNTNTHGGGFKLRNFCFNSNRAQSQLKLLSPNMRSTPYFKPQEEVEYVIEAKSQFFGLSRERITFNFERFKISRFIEIEVRDESNLTPSIGTGPIHRNVDYTRNMWKQKGDFIPGDRPVKAPAFIKVRIEDYSIPEYLKTAVLENYTVSDVNEAISTALPCLEMDLTSRNYIAVLDGLLHLEEIQLFHIFRKYDKEHAVFHRENDYLVLRMDNVAESRPSIVIGDSIKAHNVWNESEKNFKPYQGFVHKVYNNRILFKFTASFHQNYNGEGYKIQFFFSRAPFRKMHYAVRNAIRNLGPEFLFPSKITTRPFPQMNIELVDEKDLVVDGEKRIDWFNPNLNIVQKHTVKNILKGEVRAMPYIIFGPPGTGKTMTLIETVLQIIRNIPHSRLIVATPSNSSANLILKRIMDSNVLVKGEYVRIVGINSIERESIDEELLPHCATCDIALEGTKEVTTVVTSSGLTLNCPKTALGRHRLTIGTCVALGQLIYMGFPAKHFTHVVIDEAGQCTEPEIMIPAMFLSRDEGQLILAGDPMQLGPIILSQHALARGLGTSFLSRILERFPYQRDRQRFKYEYDERLVTKLIYSYRAIPSVLKVYSDMFYNSSLRSMVSEENSPEIKLLNNLHPKLPNPDTRVKTCGVFFWGIRGENQQTSDSPSWFNTAEARTVFMFVIKLFQINVKASDIGIITPYNQQVRVIRKLFDEAEIASPKCGSVEEFQGQERNIILVSTVRSTVNLVSSDKRHSLGFVDNSKRLNVAISRAKSLLAVFGNPHLLCMDANWRNLIAYCVQNKTYTGCDLPENFNNMMEPKKVVENDK